MGVMAFARSAGSFADEAESVYEGYRVVRGVLTFSASYATGGDTLPLATIGLKEVHKMLVDQDLAAPFGNLSGLAVNLDKANPAAPKVLALVATTGGSGATIEVANATNLGTKAVPVWLLGFG